MITVRRTYEERVRDFRWEVPEEFNFGALIDAWGTDRSRVALYWEDEGGRRERLTFWDVRQASNRFMNALAALGVGRGDPVMIMLPRVGEASARSAPRTTAWYHSGKSSARVTSSACLKFFNGASPRMP